MEFRNMYVIALVVVLLFGVGLGYQINEWVSGSETTETAQTTQEPDTTATPTGTSPQTVSEIYGRTGKVEAITTDSITFVVYTQNSDGTFTKATLTASIPAETPVTKINLRDTDKTVTSIALSDISTGSEVEISSDTNIYGKTSFTASSVQLHEL